MFVVLTYLLGFARNMNHVPNDGGCHLANAADTNEVETDLQTTYHTADT